jgi:hypothetical protein
MAAKTFPLEPDHATLDDAIWNRIAQHLESTGNPASVERMVEFGRTMGAARIDTQRSLRRLYGLGMVSFIGTDDLRDFEGMTGEGGDLVLRAVTVADPDLPTPGPTPDPEGRHVMDDRGGGMVGSKEAGSMTFTDDRFSMLLALDQIESAVQRRDDMLLDGEVEVALTRSGWAARAPIKRSKRVRTPVVAAGYGDTLDEALDDLIGSLDSWAKSI